jgi:hypothetical protein
MDVFSTLIIGALSSGFTMLIAYLTGFRLQKSQVLQTDTQTDGMKLTNFNSYVQLNNEIMDDMKAQIQELLESRRIEREDNKKLQERVAALTKSNNNLCREVAQLKDSFCNDCPKKIIK